MMTIPYPDTTGAGDMTFFYHVAPNPTYEYYVLARNSFGTSNSSDTDTGFARIIISLPAVPAYVWATDGTYQDKVRVSWGKSDGAAFYVLYRALDTGGISFYTQIAETGSTFYDDYTAERDKAYHYRVSAKNFMLESGYSSSDLGYRTRTIYLCPQTPAGVSASDGEFVDKIRVSWDPAESATGYTVYRLEQFGAIGMYTALGDTPDTQYDDATAEFGKTHFYKIKATNFFGESGFSEADEGYLSTSVIPDIPTGLTASDGTYPDKVHVSWDVVSEAETYKLYRAPVSHWIAFYELIAETSATGYDDTTARFETRYNYSVRAANSIGDSEYCASDQGWRHNENACRADIDHDLDVDGRDLYILTQDFERDDCSDSHMGYCSADIDDDCAVDESDLEILAEQFGRIGCPE